MALVMTDWNLGKREQAGVKLKHSNRESGPEGWLLEATLRQSREKDFYIRCTVDPRRPNTTGTSPDFVRSARAGGALQSPTGITGKGKETGGTPHPVGQHAKGGERLPRQGVRGRKR